MRWVAAVLGLGWGMVVLSRAVIAAPEPICLPQLRLQLGPTAQSVVHTTDDWQVYLNGVAISDAQLADWAQVPALVERTTAELESRGGWVFVGIGAAALGTAVSSAGWVLYGANDVSQTVTLSMAVGGLALGLGGVLAMSDWIQRPLEPHLAPTPVHRLTRAEAKRLVAAVNEMWWPGCPPAAVASGGLEPAP